MLATMPHDTNDGQASADCRLDDRLYGKLLEVNAALKDAGGVLIIVYSLLLLTAYMALWFGWYKSLWFLNGPDLNNVWVYLIVFVVVFFVWIAHFQLAQWWCYRRNRSELLDDIQRASVRRHQLLAIIARDKLLATVTEVLTRDRWVDESDRFFSAHVK